MKKTVGTIIVGILLLIGAPVLAAEPKALPAESGAGAKAAAGAEKATAAPGVAAKEGAKEEGKAAAPQGEGITVTLQVPAFSSRFAQVPVALVNDDPILMEDFTKALESIHEATGTGAEKKAGKKDYAAVLNRLITARLIIQEGANMGLDELPDVKKSIAAFAESSLKEILKRHQLKDLKPDEKTVEKLYKEAVQEWKIRSVKFDKKADAEEMAKALAAGGKFDELADKLIDSGKVQGAKQGEYVKPKDLLPQIAAVIATLKPGEVTPAALQIGPAFTIIKLEDIRYPEGNAEAMEEARSKALELKGNQVLEQYWESLKKKYVKIHKKVLAKLDFEAAKPGFKALLKDKRVVAEIKGQKPITVGQLAGEMQKKFFHGVEEAVKMKRVNEGKIPTLDGMLLDRVFRMEAQKQGVDKSEEYRQANKKYRDSLLFGMFVDKVIVPEIKVTNGEIEDYYKEHIGDYSTPEMMKIKSLAFTRKNDAEAAIDKLRKGAEFQWLQANAAGQAAAGSPGLLEFGDTPWITKNLNERVQRAVAAAKAGDIRLYESPEGYDYVLYIQDVIPAKPAPLETVRKEIAQKIFGAKVAKSIEDWSEKLRKAYTVKVFLVEQGK